MAFRTIRQVNELTEYKYRFIDVTFRNTTINMLREKLLSFSSIISVKL